MRLLFLYISAVIAFLVITGFLNQKADSQNSPPELVCLKQSNPSNRPLDFCNVPSYQRSDYSVPASLGPLRQLILHSGLETSSFGLCYGSLHGRLSSSKVSQRSQESLPDVSLGFFYALNFLNDSMKEFDFSLEFCEYNESPRGDLTHRQCMQLKAFTSHGERLTAVMEELFGHGKVTLSSALAILEPLDSLSQVIHELLAPDQQTGNDISASQLSSEQTSYPATPTTHFLELIGNVSNALAKARLELSLSLKAAFTACLGDFISPWQEVLQLTTQFRAFFPGNKDLKAELAKIISFSICNTVAPLNVPDTNTAIQGKLPCFWPACKDTCQLLEEVTANPLLRSHLKGRFQIVWTSAQDLKKTCTPSKMCVQPELVNGLMRRRLRIKPTSSRDMDQPIHLCRGPLKWTDNPDHRLQTRSVYPSIRVELQNYFNASFNITSKHLDKLLQCGLSCEGDLYNFTESEIKWLRAFTGLSGWTSVISCSFACLTFFVHFHSMQALPKQLVFSVNVGLLLLGISFTPAPFKSSNLACHDDGTTRLQEPSSSTACSTIAILFFIGFSHMSVMSACFGHALWEVIRQLQNVQAKRSEAKKKRQDRRRLLIYTGLSLAVTLPSLSVALAGKKFAGVPLVRTCSIQMDPMFNHLTVPAIIALSISLFFLILGIWKLVMIRRFSNRITKTFQRTGSGKKTQGDTEAVQKLRRVIRQMIIQLLGTMFATAGYVGWGTTMRRFAHIWEDGIVDNVKCHLKSEDSSPVCPPIKFPLSLVEFILLILIPGISSVILSSWAISPQYWPCLRKVSNMRKLPFRKSSKLAQNSGTCNTFTQTSGREQLNLRDQRSLPTSRSDKPQGHKPEPGRHELTSTSEQKNSINESV